MRGPQLHGLQLRQVPQQRRQLADPHNLRPTDSLLMVRHAQLDCAILAAQLCAPHLWR